MYVYTVYTVATYSYIFKIIAMTENATNDTKVALRTFDEHFHLMTLIEPCCVQESLQSLRILRNSDPFTSTSSLPSSTVMENVLKEVRNCIECNGAEKFIIFVNVLQTEGRYVVLGCHMFSKLLLAHVFYCICILPAMYKYIAVHCDYIKAFIQILM